MTEHFRRLRLFLGSFALLFVLFAVRFETVWLQFACAALAVIGFADMVWIGFVVTRRTSADPIRVASVVDKGPEISGYLATYLLPFVTVAEPKIRDICAYVIFLVVLAVVYIRSEMTQINPTLYLLGRRVVHVRTDGGWDGHIIVRSRSVAPGSVLRVASLNPAVRVEVPASTHE
ncbi:hypothetical protein EB75_21720 [Mycobacterium sp. ST-F2]|uniref:hypothetical protein n=1 Tax=Mycobacterium sp. ST-F2 TaxID=1490484 RepID=UPI00093ADF53|nr:hypothetical protein [Mycobacterium sp. ST-F2]OKH80012.1 hypothetical protein EB75_21720 [Mycobacterium sp. ST-F2]